ncbi:MAG: hypothetical protein V3V06_03840 [Dehalococcoidia bacterium]
MSIRGSRPRSAGCEGLQVAQTTGETLLTPTNVSWGGDDMQDLYIGSIATDYVLKARSPAPGLPLVHQR